MYMFTSKPSALNQQAPRKFPLLMNSPPVQKGLEIVLIETRQELQHACAVALKLLIQVMVHGASETRRLNKCQEILVIR